MENDALYGVGGVIALVAIIRQVLNGWQHLARVTPLLTLAVAMGWQLLTQTWDADSVGTILKGAIVTGLMANGTYSAGKALVGK